MKGQIYNKLLSFKGKKEYPAMEEFSTHVRDQNEIQERDRKCTFMASYVSINPYGACCGWGY